MKLCFFHKINIYFLLIICINIFAFRKFELINMIFEVFDGINFANFKRFSHLSFVQFCTSSSFVGKMTSDWATCYLTLISPPTFEKFKLRNMVFKVFAGNSFSKFKHISHLPLERFCISSSFVGTATSDWSLPI